MLIRFLISFFVMFILDMIWIGIIAKQAYFNAYGHVLRLQDGHLLPIWWSVALVYIALVFGVNYFGLTMHKDSFLQAVIHSAVFGLITYMVYDFTCLALFKDWPIGMSIIDCIWGATLCGSTAYITLMIEKILPV